MPWCCPAYYTHVEGTTGQDSYARQKFAYDSKCAQCGVAIDDNKHVVAAHVMRNDCTTCCLRGRMVLLTTCKRCNNASHPNGASFAVWCWHTTNEVPLDREDAMQCLPPGRLFVVRNNK